MAKKQYTGAKIGIGAAAAGLTVLGASWLAARGPAGATAPEATVTSAVVAPVTPVASATAATGVAPAATSTVTSGAATKPTTIQRTVIRRTRAS